MGDARRVKGVKVLKNPLNKILALAPVEFKQRLSDPEFESGFISQDFAKVFPEYVFKTNANDNGTNPLPTTPEPFPRGWFVKKLEAIIPWIVGAIQELAGDLDQLKKRANKKYKELDAKIVALESQVLALQGIIAQNNERFAPIESELVALDKRIDTLEAP